MECTVCLKAFDHEARRPKSMPCGHTLCLKCLLDPAIRNLCPQDRQAFEGDPTALPDNFALLAVVAEARVEAMWCELCRRQYSGACADAGHRPCSKRQRQAAQQKQETGADVAELQRELGELCSLQQVAHESGAGVTELRRELQDGLQELRRLVQHSGIGVAELRQEFQELRWSVQQSGVTKLRREFQDELQEQLQSVRELRRQSVEVAAELRKEFQDELQFLWGAVQQFGADVAELRRKFQDGLQELRTPVQGQELQKLRQPVQKEELQVQRYRFDLNMAELSSSPKLTSERNVLLSGDGDRLSQVRKLTSLNCGVDAAWAEAVLHKVAPHVEDLQVYNADLQHLRAIQGMSALKHLHLTCVGLDARADVPLLPLQLQKLTVNGCRKGHLASVQQMSKLRNLSLTGNGRIPFEFTAMPDHCGIREMKVVLKNTDTLLSLVRAHAATIVQLTVGVASSEAYNTFHPDLPRRLHECGLVELRTLQLVRLHTDHDVPSCREQVGLFRARFGRDVVLKCNFCTA